MKICPNCGHENGDAGKFCDQCGTKLVEAPKYCPECGNKLEGTSKFCPQCGCNLATGAKPADDDSDDEYEEYSYDSNNDENEYSYDSGDDDYSEEVDDSDGYEEYVDEDEYADDETTEEKIKKIVDKYIAVIGKNNTWYNSTDAQASNYSQVFQNVRSNIAKDASQSEIAGYIDTTVFGKGKAGLLFTTEALYENSAGALWKVPYYRMGAMTFTGKKIVFNGTDDCGIGWLKKGIDITIDSLYYNVPALKDCLDEIYAIV